MPYHRSGDQKTGGDSTERPIEVIRSGALCLWGA